MLIAVLRLVLALLRTSGLKLEQARVEDAEAKRRLLGAMERARRVMPLDASEPTHRVLDVPEARRGRRAGHRRMNHCAFCSGKCV
jgi:hypothetical protein